MKRKRVFLKTVDRQGPIGLIAGGGEFPLLFAKAASSLKREVIVFGIEGHTDKRVEAFVKKAHYVTLGAVGRLVELLKESKVKQVVLAGGIPKRELYNPAFQLDDEAKTLIRGTSNKGDDHLLKALELLLKIKCGVSVMDSRIFLKDAVATKGVMTRRAPTEEEWKDLRFGYPIAKGIGKLDIGQTVVVKNCVVLAVEAIEGTDRAIQRGVEFGREGTVIVKVAKPNQDLRFDLPCIGVETIETMKRTASKVLGVEAEKTIMLFRDKVIEAADAAGITLVGL